MWEANLPSGLSRILALANHRLASRAKLADGALHWAAAAAAAAAAFHSARWARARPLARPFVEPLCMQIRLSLDELRAR